MKTIVSSIFVFAVYFLSMINISYAGSKEEYIDSNYGFITNWIECTYSYSSNGGYNESDEKITFMFSAGSRFALKHENEVLLSRAQTINDRYPMHVGSDNIYYNFDSSGGDIYSVYDEDGNLKCPAPLYMSQESLIVSKNELSLYPNSYEGNDIIVRSIFADEIKAVNGKMLVKVDSTGGVSSGSTIETSVTTYQISSELNKLHFQQNNSEQLTFLLHAYSDGSYAYEVAGDPNTYKKLEMGKNNKKNEIIWKLDNSLTGYSKVVIRESELDGIKKACPFTQSLFTCKMDLYKVGNEYVFAVEKPDDATELITNGDLNENGTSCSIYTIGGSASKIFLDNTLLHGLNFELKSCQNGMFLSVVGISGTYGELNEANSDENDIVWLYKDKIFTANKNLVVKKNDLSDIQSKCSHPKVDGIKCELSIYPISSKTFVLAVNKPDNAIDVSEWMESYLSLVEGFNSKEAYESGDNKFPYSPIISEKVGVCKDYLGYANDDNPGEIADFLDTIYTIIKIGSILLTIVMSMFDISGVVSKSKDELFPTLKKWTTRLIILVIVLLAPTFIEMLGDIILGTKNCLCGIK